MRNIGRNIRQQRERCALTQDALGEKLFVTRQTVSNYETGRSRPDVDMLMRIAEALDCDVNTLLYGSSVREDRQAALYRLKRCGFLLLPALLLSLLFHPLSVYLVDRYYLVSPVFSSSAFSFPSPCCSWAGRLRSCWSFPSD